MKLYLGVGTYGQLKIAGGSQTSFVSIANYGLHGIAKWNDVWTVLEFGARIFIGVARDDRFSVKFWAWFENSLDRAGEWKVMNFEILFCWKNYLKLLKFL